MRSSRVDALKDGTEFNTEGVMEKDVEAEGQKEESSRRNSWAHFCRRPSYGGVQEQGHCTESSAIVRFVKGSSTGCSRACCLSPRGPRCQNVFSSSMTIFPFESRSGGFWSRRRILRCAEKRWTAWTPSRKRGN